MKFQLDVYHRNTPDQELIDDLKRVAKYLKKETVTIDEYNENGKFSASTLARRFGSWFKSLEFAKLQRTRTLGVSDEEYFKNLEDVWSKIGRQPKYNDMQKPLSKYVAGAYSYRFGTWRKALKKFVSYVDSEKTELVGSVDIQRSTSHTTKRSISWRLRFIILKRDNFKCRICGRSPSNDPRIVLEIDHIKPWSNGGETIHENLQTLCSVCNSGKSNIE